MIVHNICGQNTGYIRVMQRSPMTLVLVYLRQVSHWHNQTTSYAVQQMLTLKSIVFDFLARSVFGPQTQKVAHPWTGTINSIQQQQQQRSFATDILWRFILSGPQQKIDNALGCFLSVSREHCSGGVTGCSSRSMSVHNSDVCQYDPW